MAFCTSLQCFMTFSFLHGLWHRASSWPGEHPHPGSQPRGSAVPPRKVTTKGSASIYLAFLSAPFCPSDQNLTPVQVKQETSSRFSSIQSNARILNWFQNKDIQLTIHLGINIYSPKKDPQRNSTAESLTSKGPLNIVLYTMCLFLWVRY